MTRRRLSVDVRVGERVELDGGRIVLVLEHKTGQRARIRIEADASVAIVARGATRTAIASQGACAPAPV